MHDNWFDRARADTCGVEKLAHLNNAGCSLTTRAVVSAQLSHLEQEALVGGYEAAEGLLPAHEDNFYLATARILGVREDEIGFSTCATEAWRRVLHGISLPAGATIAFDSSIYGSNLLALLDGQERFQWRLRPVALDDDGSISLNELEAVLAGGVDLLAVTHMPAQSGVVSPLAQIVDLAHSAGAPVLVDACQTLGQLPISVQEVDFDALIFTGRKYLRAPRGTGGLCVRERMFDRLRPLGPDIRSAELLDRGRGWSARSGAVALEQWERNWANFVGAGVAARQLGQLDANQVWIRVQSLAEYLVAALQSVAGVQVRRRGAERGGIVVFDVPGLPDLRVVRDRLRERQVNVMYAGPLNAPLDADNGSRGWLRASVHYYNNEDDLDRLVLGLAELTARTD